MVGARHRVIHERSGQRLAARRIVDAVFHHGLAQALRDAAMRLPVKDHRVDRAPYVVDPRIAHDLHGSGFRIDLDLADMAAIGKGRDAHGFV